MPTKKTHPRSQKQPATGPEGGESPRATAARPVKRDASTLSEIVASGSFREWVAAAEQRARQEPLKCAGLALAVGVVGSILPLGRVIGSLVRPVLIIAGVVKVLEEVERRRNP